MANFDAKKATHPKYDEMVTYAIEDMKERRGSSRAAILKYIRLKYKVSDNIILVNNRVKGVLKKGVVDGSLIQVTGTGASGSFKLNTFAKLEKNVTKAAAKKPKSPKKVAKAATEKPAMEVAKAATENPAMEAAKTEVKKAAKKSVKKESGL